MIILTTACKTRVVIIPSDKEIKRIEANTTFNSSINGWFVPDARMQEIMLKLGGFIHAENITTKTNQSFKLIMEN